MRNLASGAAYDCVVVGGGFFGCIMACHLAQRGARTLICERGPDILLRASMRNQARVHNGYHYPRSILTALRSRVNFPRFSDDYRDCIDSSFEALYAVPRQNSKVSASQFATFMRRIGASIHVAPDKLKRLFDERIVEEVFRVTEYAFDAVKLREHCRKLVAATGVDLWVGAEALAARPSGGLIELTVSVGGSVVPVRTGQAINCTYSQINGLLRASDLPSLRFKHEITELCLVDVPDELRKVAVTVMCGPFFSIMPFPSRQLHTLSHVRYTPHCSWMDDDSASMHPYDYLEHAPKLTHFPHMVRDAMRFLPVLRHVKYVESLWEVKTVLPQSEVDDSRPILLYEHPELPGLTSVMGAKIDNIYDVIAEYERRPQQVSPHGPS